MPESVLSSADYSYEELVDRISQTYVVGRQRAVRAVNTLITETYWQIGHDIVEYEQGGKVKAEYGQALLTRLSRDLTRLHGRGFSHSNLVYMRLFYLRYPISQKPSDLLSWSHYVELLKIDDEMNLYLGYFASEENVEGDDPPIGLILTRHKDELLVEYATYEMNSQLFVQKYQLYLPDRDELRRQLEMTLLHAEQQAEREAGQDDHATEAEL